MNENAQTEQSSRPRSGFMKVAVIGMAGYLLGSFFPAGYIRYLIQSQLFPETMQSVEPEFDRSRLRNALVVMPDDLISTLDNSAGLFRQKYLDKPVKLSGTIKYFLNGASSDDELTLTLDNGRDYGTGIIMTFDDPGSSGVVALRKDGPVSATCMVTGISSSTIHLDHCEVS